MIPCVVCAVAGLWLYYTAKKEERRLAVVLCKECGQKFSLEDVQYSFVSERRSTGSPNNQGIIHFSVVHTYRFDCKCAQCGAQSTFNSDFLERTGQIKNKVILHETPKNVEGAILDFFS